MIGRDSQGPSSTHSGEAPRWRNLPTTVVGGAPFSAHGAVVGPGTIVGRYELLTKAGEGGMGVVYRALDPELDRHVAVKLVHPRRLTSTAASARLLREARAVARLNHPNVVRVLDIGEHEGQMFFAMEWISGFDLRRWSARGRSTSQILDAFFDAGRGLVAAHAEGLVHRDFKPTNVLVGNDGQVRVLDFGLARELDTARSSSGLETKDDLEASMTLTGTVVGTPPYMAPELHHGAPPTAATDQYAFCVSLWECLFGERPFGGETLEALLASQKTLAVPPANGPQMPRHIPRALIQGLHSDPSRRPASMSALLRALQGPPRGRWGWPLASVCTAGALWLSVPAAATSTTPCDTSEPPSWGTEARAIVDGDDQGPTDASAVLVDSLEGVASAWTSAFGKACDASLDPAHREAALHCLAEQHDHIDKLVVMLSDGDRATRDRVAEEVARLRAPADCIQQAILGDVPPRPADAHHAQRVDALRRTLASSRLQHRLGDYEGALALARRAAASARTIGFPPATAEALETLATQEQDAYNRDEARRLYERAFGLARAADYDTPAIRAALGIATLLADEGTPDAAERWIRHAEALVDEEAPADFPVSIAHTRAMVAYARGDLDDAAVHFGSAILLRAHSLRPSIVPLGSVSPSAGHDVLVDQVLAATASSEDLQIGASLHNLGLVLQGVQAPELAVRIHERAYAVQERALGAGHPRLWNTGNGLAMAQSSAGDHDAARARFVQTVEEIEARHGSNHPELYEPLLGLGAELVALEHAPDAAAPLRRALALARDTHGEDHRFTAMAAFNLAVALAAFEHPEAEALAHEARRLARRAFGDEHPQTKTIVETLDEDTTAH